jgi:trigger factor
LRVVSAPHIEDLRFEPGLSLSFSTLVDLAPEFKLPEYKNITVKKTDDNVTDEEVEKTLQSLREQRADFVDLDPPRPLAMEDFAVLSYSGQIEGKPIKEWAPDLPGIGENPNFWLRMTPDAFLPKFAEQAVGMNIGDRREINVEFPADFPQAILHGKKAAYQVELKEIKTRKLPELNDALAQEIAKLNLDELRTRLKTNLGEQKKMTARRDHTRQIVDHLLKSVDFELPESVVASETSQVVFDIVAENQARGVPSGLLEEKKTEIFANAASSAKQSVKLKLIAGKIAEQEKITVDQQELLGRLQELAQQQDMAIDKLIREMSKNGSIEEVQERLLMQKVIDFLLQAAKVE